MIIENGFDFDNLRSMALCHYLDSPKTMTLMQHTMLVDTTEVFCVDENRKKIQIFVPKQKLHTVRSKKGGNFIFVQIALEEGRNANYWLVVFSEHRQGFLFPIELITFEKSLSFSDSLSYILNLFMLSKFGRVFSCVSNFFI